MFRLQLFKIRAFTSGVVASFLAAIEPRRADVHADHLAAGDLAAPPRLRLRRAPRCGPGIAMLPLTVGFLIAGPVSGILSDRYGARPFATGGMIGTAICFVLLEALPIDFPYWVFGDHLVPDRAHDGVLRLAQPRRGHEQPAARAPRRRVGHEHHVPELGPGALHRDLLHADDRRAGLVAAAQRLGHGLLSHGVPPDVAERASHLPPISTLFAAFLGYNPVQHLVGAGTLAHLTAAQQAALAGRSFFPGLIAAPFQAGLHAAFDFAIVASLAGGRGVVDPRRALRLHAGRRGAGGRARPHRRRPDLVRAAPVTRAAGGPLRIASLAKQVPVAASFRLEEGRLVRRGVDVEMNAYCRRAVAEGVTLARATQGTCTAITLGPPGAEDVLREAIAWGATSGLHICDPAFAGSDTLATARALAAVLRAAGPFDLVLLGRNSIDGETGQVGPEVAALLDLPFASGVRALEDDGACLRLVLEHDDGMQEVEIALPAVLSVAERLCEPCKVDPQGRAAVPASLITRVTARELGDGPWGQAGSPTVVGETRPMEHDRSMLVLEGPVEEQVRAAVHELTRRGALDAGPAPVAVPVDGANGRADRRAGGLRPSPCARYNLPAHRRARRARPPGGHGRAARGRGAPRGGDGGRRPRALPRRRHVGRAGRGRRRSRRRAQRVERSRGRRRRGR